MIKTSLMLLRNKKINLIYTLLFVIINILISLFYVFRLYHNYLYDICLNYKENREYVILTTDEKIIKKINNTFEVEQEQIVTDVFDDNPHYIVLLKDGNDSKYLKKYLEDSNIEGYLVNTEKLRELEVIEKQANMFNYFFIFVLILTFIIFIFLIKNIIVNIKKYLFLLKALGYNRFQLNFILFLKLFLTILLSVIISYLIIYLVHFFCLLINDLNLKIFLMNLNILKVAIPYIIIILLSLVVSIFINLLKYKKLEY